MVAWFKTKETGRYPVIGALDQQGRLLGFASQYSIEHSVYVERTQRRKSVGVALMQRLIAAATQQQYHCMGFAHAGTIRQAGFKFGRWLDLGFWQLLLKTPENPQDG